MGYTKLDIKGIRVKALSSKKAKDKALEKAEKKVAQEKNKLIEDHNRIMMFTSPYVDENIKREFFGMMAERELQKIMEDGTVI